MTSKQHKPFSTSGKADADDREGSQSSHSNPSGPSASEKSPSELLDFLVPMVADRARLMRSHSAKLNPTTSIGQTGMPWFILSRVAGVRINPGGRGGYLADILLTKVPSGLPNVFGTPVETPLPDYASAVDAALTMLALALINEESGAQAQNDPAAVPEFVLYGCPIRIPRHLMMLASPIIDSTDEAQRRIRSQIDEFVEESLSNGVSEQELARLPHEERTRLTCLLCCALTADILIHPEHKPGVPQKPATRH